MLGLFVCQELMRCLFFRLRQSNLASHRLASPALPVYRFRRRTLISHSLKPAWSDRSSLLRERSQAGLPSPPPLSFMGLNHLETFAIRCARSINLLRIRLEPSSQFGFFCHLIARYYSAYNSSIICPSKVTNREEYTISGCMIVLFSCPTTERFIARPAI